MSKHGVAIDQQNYPMLATVRRFNCGGIAPLSIEVGAEMLRVPQYVIEFGPAPLLAHDETFLGIDRARETMARILGADSDEIAFTTQFSTAIDILTEGLAWEAGQEVIATDQEHPAMLIPLMNAVKRHELVVHRIPWTHDQNQFLADFRAALNPNTRLVAMSHITTDSGAIAVGRSPNWRTNRARWCSSMGRIRWGSRSMCTRWAAISTRSLATSG